MNFDEVLQNRRSINFFDPHKPVGPGLIKQLVELAALAPSGFNLQPWSLIVLTDSADKEKLQKLAWDQPKVTQAPVVFIVLADRDGWKEGQPFVEKNFKQMVKVGAMQESQREWFADARASLYGQTPEKELAFAVKNTGFFAMSLMLVAKSLGLDTHPMDGFDHEAVKKAFNIPDQYWVPLLLAIGYFDDQQTLEPPKWRKTYDEIVVRFD
jgi:nitroreductase